MQLTSGDKSCKVRCYLSAMDGSIDQTMALTAWFVPGGKIIVVQHEWERCPCVCTQWPRPRIAEREYTTGCDCSARTIYFSEGIDATWCISRNFCFLFFSRKRVYANRAHRPVECSAAGIEWINIADWKSPVSKKVRAISF